MNLVIFREPVYHCIEIALNVGSMSWLEYKGECPEKLSNVEVF